MDAGKMIAFNLQKIKERTEPEYRPVGKAVWNQ